MKKIGVRFYDKDKIYYYNPEDFFVKRGFYVIVDSIDAEDEEEIAEVVTDIIETEEKEKPIKRMPTKKEIETYDKLKGKEEEIFRQTIEIINKQNLEMKLVEVKYKFDGTKLTFFYTAEGRVDFRELLKILAGKFRTRIEMRQIGVRDEIKLRGDYGKCGRPLCCKVFLKDLEVVTMKMAKDQNLSLNPGKITGCCGRLMCCLNYEQDVYREKLERLPNVGEVVETRDGKGEVVSLEILKEGIRVKHQDGPDFYFKDYRLNEIEKIKEKEETKTEKEKDNKKNKNKEKKNHKSKNKSKNKKDKGEKNAIQN